MALRVPTIVYLSISLHLEQITYVIMVSWRLISGRALVAMNSVRQWPASPYLNTFDEVFIALHA